MMLSRGLTMSDRDIGRIVPLLATFCSMFSHSLHTLHDADFYEDTTGKLQADLESLFTFYILLHF
jgi:ubiquitin-protein ligase E3 C